MFTARQLGLCWVSFSWVFGVFAVSAHAGMSREDYLKALEIADRHVQRKKALEDSANALSLDLARSLYGRDYQVGDRWDVASLRIDSGIMRMTEDPEQIKDKPGMLGILRYEVKEVKRGNPLEVLIHVRQLEAHGQKIVDPNVDFVSMTVDQKLRQTKTEYHFRPDATARARVSAAGPHYRFTPLSMLPLDVPDVMTAVRENFSQLPELPEPLRLIAEKVGYKIAPDSSDWYEQDDFFGRPVQFVWRKGDPWPAFLKTPQGFAILLRKGGS